MRQHTHGGADVHDSLKLYQEFEERWIKQLTPNLRIVKVIEVDLYPVELVYEVDYILHRVGKLEDELTNRMNFRADDFRSSVVYWSEMEKDQKANPDSIAFFECGDPFESYTHILNKEQMNSLVKKWVMEK